VVQNLGPNASNPLRVYVSAMTGASLRGSGATFEPIPTNKLFLAATPTVVLGPGQTNLSTIAGTIPAPTADQGSSVGEGWGAYAELQEQPAFSTNWFTVDEVLITFGNWPNFNGVSGPGGGAIRLDPDYVGLSADNPLASVVIVGPSSVRPGRTTNYFGKATYTLGDTYTFTQTVWTASLFTITNGVFTAGSVTSNTVVTLGAAYTNDGFRFVVSTNITIPGPPKFTSFKLTNGALLFTLTGNSNTSYRIEAATNLSPPTNTFWLPLVTNTLTNTVWNYTDFSRTNFSQRFYRAREL
jgi:hypothetical protein